MARILVTGGAGFVGSHLVERLLIEGHEVLCLDNFDTGTKQSLVHLREHPFLEVWRHDVCQPIVCEVDQIFHLACPASPAYYLQHPVKTIETCVVGMHHVMELAKRCQARVVFASSSEVYGDPLTHPQVESDWGHVNPVGQRSCYNEGKRAAEAMAMAYQREYDIDIRVARLFNSYGPRMRLNDGRVISNFIVQALRGEPLKVYGTGQQTRSFCYINDTIEAMVRLMTFDLPEQQTPINIGNPEEVTVIDLARKVIQMVNEDLQVTFAPLPQDDPRQRQPEINLAKKLLGWTPLVDLNSGLALTLAYYEEYLSQAMDTCELESHVPELI